MLFVQYWGRIIFEMDIYYGANDYSIKKTQHEKIIFNFGCDDSPGFFPSSTTSRWWRP
jgi:hypothetical protein